MEQIKLMIADDHIMFRDGLKQLFEMENRYRIIAEAGDGEECLGLLSDIHPDILLLDLNMPVLTGFDVLQKLHENQKCGMKVLILTFHKELDYVTRAAKLGADGYVWKGSEFEELKKAIEIVLAGNIYFQEDLENALSLDGEKDNGELDRINCLTKRELDVLRNLSVGMFNKEIAMKLNISERTVKNHVSNIFKKVGVADRTQAAVFAIRNHLITIDE